MKRKKGLQGAFGGEEKVSRQNRSRPNSPASSSDQEKPAGAASNHLMSEAQAVAMLKKQRTTSPVRGSMRAQSRIKKEMQAWESAKLKNPEYWKPPKFCQVLGKRAGPPR